MGFIPEDDTYNLSFEDGRYTGLRVTMTGLDVGELLDSLVFDAGVDIDKLTRAADTKDVEALSAGMDQMRAKVEQTYVTFARHLVKWNVETKTRKPVPPTLVGVKSLKVTFIRDIMTAWRSGVMGADADLKDESRNGVPALEQSIPMEPLSSSLPS